MSFSSSTPSSQTLDAAPSLPSHNPAMPADTSSSRNDPPTDTAPPAEPQPSLAQATTPSLPSAAPEIEPDFAQLGQLSLAELYPRYKELCEADDEYRMTGDTWKKPDELLPNNLMERYQTTLIRAQKRSDEPSISSDLLSIWEGMDEVGEWKRLRRMDGLDKLAERLIPLAERKAEVFEFALRKHRRKRRQSDILWLDDLWQRCLTFEGGKDVTSSERVKERFRRFPHGVFPKLAERNAAERQATDESSS